MTAINKVSSFTAAGSIPMKIFANQELYRSMVDKGHIPLVHLQLCPTNFCNLHCSFCSCSKRDKKLQLTLEQIQEILDTSKKLGCQSLTVTGGGEPLLHPSINEILGYALFNHKIKVGLVSNGILIKNLKTCILNEFTWMRISLGDERVFDETFEKNLSNAVFSTYTKGKGFSVDWSFSYVVGKKPNLKLIKKMVKFANAYQFTHIRMTQDILNPTANYNKIQKYLKTQKVDDSKVIYQDRSQYVPGAKRCLISLLKPTIGADGKIYPCCGVQYALKKPSKDFEKTMRMGDISELEQVISRQKCFDGSKCVKCYYNTYNVMLAAILDGVKHGEFV